MHDNIYNKYIYINTYTTMFFKMYKLIYYFFIDYLNDFNILLNENPINFLSLSLLK